MLRTGRPLRRLMTVALALLGLLCSQAPALAQTTRPAAEARPGVVTIGAYNVENMFDVYDDPYTLDETTPPKGRGPIEKVARNIRGANPDVVSFEELENEGVLREVIKQFLPDSGYDYVAANKSNGDRGINLGVASRLPILSMTSHRFVDFGLPGSAEQWRFARDLWRVELQAPGKQVLVVYIVHLKSKHDSGSDRGSKRWRLAEALEAHRIIGREMEANPDRLLAMIGDFNDEPGSDPIKALLEPFSDKAGGLTDIFKDYPQDRAYTYVPLKYRSRIDYILCSPALLKRLVPGSAKIHNEEGPDLDGSDHAIITASFDLSK